MKHALCLFCLLLGCPGMVFGLEVHFKSEALVEGPMLTLGDVAEVQAGHKSAAFENIVLFPAPQPGEQRCYDKGTLQAYICEGLAGTDLIEWSGAETICIRQEGGRLVEPGVIQQYIDEALHEAVGHLGADHIGFEVRNTPQALSLPQGEISTEVLFSDPDVLESRQVSVLFRVNGQVKETLTLAGRVTASAPVIVTAQKLHRGTVLKRDHLLLKERNMAELQDPCLDFDSALGKRLKRTVPMNTVLRRHDLDRPVVIERRELVTMLLKKGGLQIRAKGVAVNDGRMGDQILVRNMRSKQEVPCRVIGPGVTKVEF